MILMVGGYMMVLRLGGFDLDFFGGDLVILSFVS